MMKAVRPRSSVRNARWTRRSEGRSRDDVASSRISTFGSARKARANATSWRCPDDSRTPRRRTSVSYPLGIAVMNSWAPITRAAFSTSSRLAPGRPKSMLSPTVPEKRKLSCVTITIAHRRSETAIERRSTPSSVTRPEVGS